MSEILSKITIFGSPGSGKTTLALKLKQKYGLPVVHLDKLVWGKGWILRPREDFIEDHRQVIGQGAWIIEGASLSTLEARYAVSDLVIFLNPPRFVCLFRIFKRFLLSRPQMPDKPEGCEEKLTWGFLKYCWPFKKRAAHQIDMLRETYPEPRVIEIRSNAEMRNLILKSPLGCSSAR